jgi:hypothetical protein
MISRSAPASAAGCPVGTPTFPVAVRYKITLRNAREKCKRKIRTAGLSKGYMRFYFLCFYR